MEKEENCFSEFTTITPKKKNQTIQILYDYEKHYMELVKKYSDEIRMIDNLLKSLRAEKVNFYKQEVPIIIEKLKKEEIIDEIIINQWIDRLSSDIEQSFLISERLIETYLTKSIEDFKQAIGDKVPW